MASLAVGNIGRTSSQQGACQGTNVDVVTVVVLSALGAIDAEWYACPLAVVAGSFKAAWPSADLPATFYISHAASEAYGVGSNHTAVVAALVAKRHAVPLVAAFVKVERAEIDPCRTAHLLVDAELRLFALVPYGVVGIVNAALNGLVADIDGILACLGNGGLVGNGAVLRLVGCRLSHTGRAGLEGVLTVNIVA